ncbi:MAG: glucosamine inositolphosphorylceramide transferase family protein [Flavobacteriaceae bacterium]
MNKNYPFFTNYSSGWSVGFNKSIDIDHLEISKNNILTSDDVSESSRFIADPFFIRKGDSLYLFVENQGYVKGATIDLFVAGNDLNFEYQGEVISEDFHMSYPQVFESNGEYYMLPETKRSNNVLLYKASKFPKKWAVSDTLIKNVRYKDPTIFKNEYGWYIITCNDDLELKCFYSDSLNSRFEPILDIPNLEGNEVRPGGRAIFYEDKILIPFQNSKYGYGSAITLKEVLFKDERSLYFKDFKNTFISGQSQIDVFSNGMHHVDFQYDTVFKENLVFYDGDKKIDSTRFNWKRTLKYNYLDLRNWILNEY